MFNVNLITERVKDSIPAYRSIDPLVRLSSEDEETRLIGPRGLLRRHVQQNTPEQGETEERFWRERIKEHRPK